MRALLDSVGRGICILTGIVSGTGVDIRLAGLGIRGAGKDGTIAGQDDGFGGGGRDGTVGVGCLVGAGVGVDDRIELGDGDGIVD